MFVKFSPQQVNLRSLDASVYIDSSGSTHGSIMRYQLDLYNKLRKILNITKLIEWNTSAKQINTNTKCIYSNGGTDPCCFLKFWSNEQLAIVFTDGQIDINSMDQFKKSLLAKSLPIPIIIVLTINTIGSRTILDIQQNINMSIPESFLSLSNDVLILLADGIMTRTLMSKGCFEQTFPASELISELQIAFDPPPKLNKLQSIVADQEVPSNLIKLPGISDYLDLNLLNTIDKVEQLDLIEQLCSRSLLAKLDLGTIHAVLDKLSKKTSANPVLDQVRIQLYQAGTNSLTAGTQVHRDLIDLYNQTKTTARSETNRAILGRINKLKQIICEYQMNSTSFTYGSNRAIKASEVSDNDLDDIGQCAQVECPIYISEGPGCIVFREPLGIPNYITKYTSDYWLESPFELGLELSKWISPGIYCREMVEQMDKNPYSMEPVIGWIPLSSDPKVVMAHMSKVFGGKKQLWHFVRAYCGLLAQLADMFWAQDNRNEIIRVLTELTQNYNVSEDLKAATKKIPLYQSFEYVVNNYSTCLRDRFYSDVMTIVKIIDLIRPDLIYPKDKIKAMCEVVKVFSELLREHKQSIPMINHVMELDEWGHYTNYKPGIKGLVGQLLWYDINGKYKLCKLQLAIDKAFSDKRFGSAIKSAFNNQPWDESILKCALPELEGHDLVYDVWVYKDNHVQGLDDLTCGYTGLKFDTTKAKLDHIKKLLGPYFFNGHSAVKAAIGELGISAKHKDIFTNVKTRLYKAYGEQAKVLHTARAKARLQQFIRILTA